MSPGDRIEAVPEGTRLVHIGPPKTGTSALQGAFHACRAETLAQGVRYAGSSRHSGSAVLAITGRPSFGKDEGAPPIRKWTNLLRDVQTAREPRVLISSEFFADAEPDAVRRVLDDLERDRVRVLVTLRRLDRIIPSQWQQYVQSGSRSPWERWLKGTLEGPGPTKTFWRRHRHDELVRRWASEVGADRVTVVVIDDRDHDHVLRVFEGLLALEPGTLVPDVDLVNRSMTMPEIEAVLAYNIAFKNAGLGNALFHKTMHFGAASYMKTREPDPTEPRIALPRWAEERIATISREMVDGIKAAGVAVIGDLEALIVPLTERDGAVSQDVCITPEIAAAMVTGIAVSAGRARGREAPRTLHGESRAEARNEEQAELARYATYQLVGAILGRIRRTFAVVLERVPLPGRGQRGGGASSRRPLTPAERATAEALAARFRSEGLVSRGADELRSRTAAYLAEAPIGEAAGEEGADEPECVPPASAAWFALGMLRASGVVRPAGGTPDAPKLKPVLWAWVEPPALSRIPSLRIAAALPPRVFRFAMRRTRRAVRRSRRRRAA